MSVVNPWARHYQAVWRERAGNPRIPYALRVAFLALGNHKANGHALFGRGEVADALMTPPNHRPDRRSVHRAIRQAIDWGYLAEGSTARCLIVPAHAVTGGLGSPTAPCPHHDPEPELRPLRSAS